MNEDTLQIGVNDPEDFNYEGLQSLQYQAPGLGYSAGPPRSIQINRSIPIGTMTNDHLDAEFGWLSDSLGHDLHNLGLNNIDALAVIMGVFQDMRLSHPDFVANRLEESWLGAYWNLFT